MLHRVLLAPLLLALAHARAAQEQGSPTSNALDRVTIDVAGDGKQPMVVEVELPNPIQLHYNVTRGSHGHGPVVIDLTEETGGTSPQQEAVRQTGQVWKNGVEEEKDGRMFCGSRDARFAFPAQSVPPARFLTQQLLHSNIISHQACG